MLAAAHHSAYSRGYSIPRVSHLAVRELTRPVRLRLLSPPEDVRQKSLIATHPRRLDWTAARMPVVMQSPN
jgi:hypothetical protein